MPIKYFLLAVAAAFCDRVIADELTLDNQLFDFGEVYQFGQVTEVARATNHSRNHVLLSVSDLPEGVEVHIDRNDLAPEQTTAITVKYSVGDRYGGTSIRIPIQIAHADKSSEEIRLIGFISSVLDNGRLGLDLGVIDTNLPPVEKPIRIESSADASLKVTKIIDVPDFLIARIGDDEKTVWVKPKKFNILGYSKGKITVGLNSVLQSQASLAVLLDQHGNVVADQNPLVLGLQKHSNRHETRLQLTSRDSKSFSVGKISTDASLHMKVNEIPCLPKPRDNCHAFGVSIEDQQPFGQIFGKIHFKLPQSGQELVVDLAGMYIADDVEVRSLDDHKTQDKRPFVDIASSLQNVTTESEDSAPPAGDGPLVKWQVGNEAAIYGYGIFRGSSVSEEFKRIGSIVRAKNTGDNTTATYQYRDNSAEAGKEYWYYITIFYNNGKKVQLTGPQKVLAK